MSFDSPSNKIYYRFNFEFAGGNKSNLTTGDMILQKREIKTVGTEPPQIRRIVMQYGETNSKLYGIKLFDKANELIASSLQPGDTHKEIEHLLEEDERIIGFKSKGDKAANMSLHYDF